MNLDIYVKYITQVLKSAIDGTEPPDLPEGADELFLLNFCRFHKLENIVYLTIKDKLSQKTRQLFENFYNRSLYLQATQQYHLDAVTEAFENNGIDYLLLKGREITSLYPSEDMRQSCDFDIYIGRDNAQRAKDIMLDIGFEILEYSDENDDHDEYIADKTVVCELHRVLIQSWHPWREECNKIPERLNLCEGTKHKMKMTNEDFYAYNLAHTAKHMKYSGIGIRAFLDMWIIKNAYKDKLNYEVLEATLKRCNLSQFDKITRKLCAYWFEDGQCEDIIEAMAEYVAKSGWVGTYEQAKSTELAERAGITSSVKAAKLKKCISIIFSPYEEMQGRYPILKKHRWLTPLCRIHRALRAVIKRRDLIRDITTELENGDMETGKAILKLKKSVGL